MSTAQDLVNLLDQPAEAVDPDELKVKPKRRNHRGSGREKAKKAAEAEVQRIQQRILELTCRKLRSPFPRTCPKHVDVTPKSLRNSSFTGKTDDLSPDEEIEIANSAFETLGPATAKLFRAFEARSSFPENLSKFANWAGFKPPDDLGLRDMPDTSTGKAHVLKAQPINARDGSLVTLIVEDGDYETNAILSDHSLPGKGGQALQVCKYLDSKTSLATVYCGDADSAHRIEIPTKSLSFFASKKKGKDSGQTNQRGIPTGAGASDHQESKAPSDSE